MTSIMITGASGYVGSALVWHLSQKYCIIPIAYQNPGHGARSVNLTDEREVAHLAEIESPDIIIHAAGKKAQACEEKPSSARINELGAQLLVKHFPSTQIYDISTDFVFDGKKGRYTESDCPNPQTTYGKTKLAGEQAYSQDKDCIVRTAGLFSTQPSGFISYVLSRFSQGKSIEAFTNIYNTPTYLPYFCNRLEAIIEERLIGLFHVAGCERVSRFEFAKLIARIFNYDEKLIRGVNAPETFLSPHDLSLDSSMIRDVLKLEMDTLSNALKEMYGKISTFENRNP